LFAGLIGGAIGGIAGLASAGGMTQMYLQYFNIPMLRVNLDVRYIFIAMLLASVICIVAGLVGTKGILHISPAEAMKAENPKTGKQIFMERIPQIWKRLSFSWKLVYKNIFRSKKRTALVVAGVIFTYGMILFTLSMPTVMDDIMNKYFTDFLKMDYSVSFVRPVDRSALYDFKGLGEIDIIEGKAEIPVEMSNGNIKKTINLLALNKNTVFYGFIDKNDEPVKIPENGLIITENLANILKVKPGDMLRLKPYSGGDAVYEQVVYVVPQSLGIGAYTNIASLDTQLLDKNLITGVNIKSKDAGLPRELYKAKNISTVSSAQDIRAMYDESLALVVVSIGVMLIFSGILGFAIVYNVTSVNIGERETEFSTLRVLGFSNNEIFRLILKENNVITIIGILLGVPVGTAMLSYSTLAFSTENYTIAMEPTIVSIVLAAIVTLLFVLLAQAATYQKINKLDFLEALKTRI
jgi:putative ABC transport system permease protein